MHRLDPLTIPLSGVNLIEASAGTGKTYTIATLYLRLLVESLRAGEPISVRNILVVTFTNAATDELRGRIRARLREALTLLRDGPAESSDPTLLSILEQAGDPLALKRHLENELTCIDEAAIHTIHGFCQRMLVENAFESGALFEAEFIQNEDELIDEVVHDYWRRHFYGIDAGRAELLQKRWKDPAALRKEIKPHLHKAVEILPAPAEALEEKIHTQWQSLSKLWKNEKENIVTLLHEDAGLGRAKDTYKKDVLDSAIGAMNEYCQEGNSSYLLPEGFALFTPDKLEASVSDAKRKKGHTAPQHEFFFACAELQSYVDGLLVEQWRHAIEWCREELHTRKQAGGRLAFDDLLIQLDRALCGEGGEALAAHIRDRFRYALIDEFQDTDPLQYRIFATLYRGQAECGLYLIGDPKQAIYAFRGADVHTYMQAKDDTKESAHFTLATNWRSSSRLIRALNTLYQPNGSAFLYPGAIDYQPVEASPRADAKPLTINGSEPAALTFWFATRGLNDKGQPNKDLGNKDDTRRHFAEACADAVAAMLLQGQRGVARIGERNVESRDIAVLVRDRFEARFMREALTRRQIGSAYYSRDSVFHSDEAGGLIQLLNAVADPTRDRSIRAALASDLIALSTEEIDRLIEDELAWEETLDRFHGYHRLWNEHGFMPMFQTLLHAERIPQRLLPQPSGERKLTNLMQLAELVQGAGREHHGIEAQLKWLHESMQSEQMESDEYRLRLESDEGLVKVVNIHTSKGLEYPIVYLPFLWSSRPVDPKKSNSVYYHDGHRTVLHLAPDEAAYARADTERLEEELRLLYVALTRAQYLCYVGYGRVRELEDSALAWLLHGGDGIDTPLTYLKDQFTAIDDAALQHPLEQLATRSGGTIAVEPLPSTYTEAGRETDHLPELRAREAQRPIPQHWRMTSYSGLSSHEGAAVHEFGSRSEDAVVEEQGSGQDIFHFPKGSSAGTFMHQVFEEIDFDRVTDAELGEKVRELLPQYGFDLAWEPVIAGMVRQVLNTPLDDRGMKLAGLTDEKRIVEMEFMYPIEGVNAAELNRIVTGLGDYTAAGPTLKFDTVSGIMRGFIDLTFEHDGRYYIVDYKSNWLGPRHQDYHPDALQAVIAQHRYDLQFLIYTLAMHRYLRTNLADYDYATHFGGVYYLFLRGMEADGGDNHGVYYAKPPLELIEQLERAIQGGGNA
jgi:exodeoxyribonuclease V beta subunit